MRALFAFTCLFGACGPPPAPIDPVHVERPELAYTELLNGKVKNLRFDTPAQVAIAVGASGFHTNVARRPQQGRYVVGDLWPEDAIVRIELPEGLTGTLESRTMPTGFSVELGCAREGSFELKVELSAKNFRLADAIDVSCVKALSIHPQSPRPTEPQRAVVGGIVSMSVLPFAGEQPLWGQLEPTVKPGEPLEALGGQVFRLLAPAREPIVVALGLEYALPIVAVDVPWSFSIGELTPLPGSPEYVQLSASAVDAQGAGLLGVADCKFTAYLRGTPVALPSSGCTYQGPANGPWAVLESAERLCVTAAGKTGCRAVER